MANKEDTAIGSTAHQPETTPTLEASLSSNSTPNSTDKGHSDDAIRPNDGSAGPATVAAGQRAAQLGLSRAQLEQEVGQVMGNLNSWWGGVKKQAGRYSIQVHPLIPVSIRPLEHQSRPRQDRQSGSSRSRIP